MHQIRELGHHQAKPDPDVLLEICDVEGILPENAAYIGDSMARDVLMAKRAGVFAIWAEYGARHDKLLYSDLVRVSHWTPEEIEREERIRREALSISPDFVARDSFLDVIDALHLADVA
jgi:phosphoglycolate phosphatase